MKSVLLFKLSVLHSAPRVQRTYAAISDKYKVTTAGYTALNVPGEDFIDLSYFGSVNEKPIDFHVKYPVIIRKAFSFFIRIFLEGGWNKELYLSKKYWGKKHKAILDLLNKKKYDIIIAHGVDAWPIGAELAEKHGSKLVFNAHEYYPREFEENKNWVQYFQPLNTFLCKKYLPKADKIFSVTESISREYKNVFGVNPITVTNATSFRNLEPSTDYTKTRIIHHGAALRSRRIHEMIECAKLLDERFTIDFMLVPQDNEYYRELKEMVKDHERISIIDPVPFKDIIAYINNYHIGLYILAKTNFNNEMALPNKFFEFIQARLMLAISPNHEMANIVRDYKIGIVADDFSHQDLAKKINALSVEDIRMYQENTAKCAAELNAEKNAELIVKALAEL